MTYPFKTHKAAANSINDVDLGKRTAVTKFATYNSLDRDKDRAHKGMFTKSWQEFTDVRIFLNHQKELAPARLEDQINPTKSMWEDSQHAYAKMWFGTHTLGNDTLKMMDEKIITDSSYYFLPTKYTKNEAGGYNFTEAFLKEVSVLTHWGAHPESKIVSVNKAAGDLAIGEAVIKQLNTDEITFLRDFVGRFNMDLVSLASFAATLPENSDLYYWINTAITELSYTIVRFKDKLVWGQKSWSGKELTERLTRLKSFAKNSTASDDAIRMVLKEAEDIESLLSFADTPAPGPAEEQSKAENDDAVQLALLNLKMILS